MNRIQIVSIIGSLILLGVILELVRKKKLREEYSLLWLLTGVVVLLCALWGDLLFFLSGLLGIVYPSNAIFLVAIVFVLAIVLHFSTVISGLSEKNEKLAQELAILNLKFKELKEGKE